MEVGFQKGQSDNLPRVDSLMVAQYFIKNKDFTAAEIRGVKMKREHGFHCVCDQACSKVDPFLKILDFADIGLKIYRYLASKYAQVAGVAASQKSGTGADVFILQNTRDKDLQSSNLIQELDTNKISCPKCKQVVAHAKRLIETLPSVNKGNVVAVCDHCRKRAKPRYNCEVCEKIVKKFISSEGRRKQQRPLDFGRSLSDVNLSGPNRMKYASVTAATGDKPKWDNSLIEIQKQLQQKLIPCFVKSQHEGGERDELRKQFQKASLIRSRSETFLNAVSGLTQEILDKTFQFYFPKGARQMITGKEITSDEFIRDTQEKYRLITEAREKIHEGTRRSSTGLELGSQEYYDEHGHPIRIGKMPEVYYDQHGQLVRRGKTPHIYYDKYGQPIPGGVMPDIYYDKYGQPVQGKRMPEVFYDEHGQPVPAGRMPDVSYDKHGHSGRWSPQVYYDKHGEPITESRTPDVYYDKHGQPIQREWIPEIYYDKHGQPITEGGTSEVYYDKHGQPTLRAQMPEVYYDKHGQRFQKGKSPEVFYDKHGQPLQRTKSPEVFYDRHGQPIPQERMPEFYYDKHGQPFQKGKSPEVYYDKHGQPLQRGKSPEVYYDKHGQPIPQERMPEVYYDKHGQPFPKGKSPEVYYDKHGQPLQRGKSPEVYYDRHGQPISQERIPEVHYDKRGQPITEGRTPEVKHGQPIRREHVSEVYYDKHGQPLQRGKSPEFYYDKDGHPVQRGKTPEVVYTKHGQPVKAQRSANIYYDEHGQPVTRVNIPEVFYDKHGQPFARDTLPDVYYDKHGQLKKGKPTSETYYDKHGRPIQKDRSPEIHYDKDRHPTHGERFANAQYDEHGRPIQVGRKSGHISEVFYDQHGKLVRGGRKAGHVTEISHDQDGKPSHGHADKSKRLTQKGFNSNEIPESRKHGTGQPSTDGSEYDNKNKKPRTGRDEMEAKELERQKASKGEKMDRNERSVIESERKAVDSKAKPPKLENKITQIPSKDEKITRSEDKRGKNTVEGKDKIAQIPSKGEKNVPSEDTKVGKVMESKDKTTQIHPKGEKQMIQDKTKADKKETLQREKSAVKSTISTTAKDEPGKISTEKEKPKSKDEELQKHKELDDKNKLKDREVKEQKSVKIGGDELNDKDVKRKDAKLAEEKGKQKDGKPVGEARKQRDDTLAEDKEKQTRQREKTETEKQKKQKGNANVFEDKLKEAKRQKEEKLNQEMANTQKQTDEKQNAEKLKAEKLKEKEGKPRKPKEDTEDKLLKQTLDQKAKQKLEEEKMKKANLDQIQKIKDALSKTYPQPLKVSEGTQKPEKPEPPQPFKIDEKLVSKSTKLVKKKSIEIPNKELDIKTIQIMRPSNEDMIAKLVTVKPIKKPPVPKINQKELEILGKIHKGHADDGLKDSQCDLCVYSELLFQLEELNEKKLMNEKKEVIIGNEVKRIIAKDFVKVKEEIQEGPGPALFKTMFTIEPTADVYDKIKTPEEPASADEPQKLKQKPNVLLQQQGEQDTKGVIKYALSDRSFIDKGWTLLPTEKVVRKMNVYRMRPAHPEFDWFEHNKKKRYLEYDSGEKLAEIDDNGRGRWFYRNGRVALDYYDAEETNAQQRFVIYSSGEPDERGRTHAYTVLATFDYLGNGIVFDHGGKIRLKYNQSEGVVLDRSLGPVSHWKWHSLNDPPVLQQVMIDTQMSFKDPEILKLGDQTEESKRQDNEEMLAIEFDNFIKEKSKKLTQKFKPFQIKMKALKINEQFSLRILDQATIYLLFRDGSTNLKLNMGMLLDHQEIVDTDTAEMGDVANNIEKLPARTDSIAALQANISNAAREARLRLERDRRLCPPVPRCSADQLRAAAARRLRQPIVPAPSGSGSASASAAERHCICRKPPYNNNLYYDTRII